jgi:hypothetical protein
MSSILEQLDESAKLPPKALATLQEKVGEVATTPLTKMLPKALIDAIEGCALKDWQATLPELEKKIWPDGTIPIQYIRVKLAFWEEYERASSLELDKLDISIALRGNCTVPHFYQTMLKKPGFVAWLMQPPATWVDQLKAIQHLSLRRMEEAASLPIERDPETNMVNTDLIKVQKTILDQAVNRLHGSVVTRIQQTQQNLHLHGKASPEVEEAANKAALEELSMDQIDAEIRQFEKRSAQAQLPGVIDVDMLKEAKAVSMIGDGTPTDKNGS